MIGSIVKYGAVFAGGFVVYKLADKALRAKKAPEPSAPVDPSKGVAQDMADVFKGAGAGISDFFAKKGA